MIAFIVVEWLFNLLIKNGLKQIEKKNVKKRKINSPADLHHLFAQCNRTHYMHLICIMHLTLKLEFASFFVIIQISFRKHDTTNKYTINEQRKRKQKQMEGNEHEFNSLNIKCICDLDITNTYHVRARARANTCTRYIKRVCVRFANVLC